MTLIDVWVWWSRAFLAVVKGWGFALFAAGWSELCGRCTIPTDATLLHAFAGIAQRRMVEENT